MSNVLEMLSGLTRVKARFFRSNSRKPSPGDTCRETKARRLKDAFIDPNKSGARVLFEGVEPFMFEGPLN